MARHDENQDLNILSKRFSVNRGLKTINVSKDQIVGIRTWARIDYLTHYCGYRVVKGNAVVASKESFDNAEKKKEYKKLKKMQREDATMDKGKKQHNKRK